MIEVFKTNVSTKDKAEMLTKLIHAAFENYQVNFDLEDCDNILRVVSAIDSIDSVALIKLIKGLGFQASVLPDEIPSNGSGRIILEKESHAAHPLFQVENLS
jgi:hypothetical protein